MDAYVFLFFFLEDTGILDTENEEDLYTLHCVFLPKVQKQLDIFREAWAHHPLRTERGTR